MVVMIIHSTKNPRLENLSTAFDPYVLYFPATGMRVNHCVLIELQHNIILSDSPAQVQFECAQTQNKKVFILQGRLQDCRQGFKNASPSPPNTPWTPQTVLTNCSVILPVNFASQYDKMLF